MAIKQPTNVAAVYMLLKTFRNERKSFFLQLTAYLNDETYQEIIWKAIFPPQLAWPQLNHWIVYFSTDSFVLWPHMKPPKTPANTIPYLPSDPLGHGLSTVSPRWVGGHWTPRVTRPSHMGVRGPCGRRGGLTVTGTVAVMGRPAGALFIAPTGWKVTDGTEVGLKPMDTVVESALGGVVERRGVERGSERR